jgi:hypothetical protein
MFKTNWNDIVLYLDDGLGFGSNLEICLKASHFVQVTFSGRFAD